MFVRFSGQGTPQIGAVGVEPTHPQVQGLNLLRFPVTPRAYSGAHTVVTARACHLLIQDVQVRKAAFPLALPFELRVLVHAPGLEPGTLVR